MFRHPKRTLVSMLVFAAMAMPAQSQVFRGLGHTAGGGPTSGAYRVSRDGSTVVGYATTSSGEYQAFRWTAATGMVAVTDFPGGLTDGSSSYSVNADGSVVVGAGSDVTQPYVAFRWTEASGLIALGDIDASASTASFANDVSDDGSVIAFQGSYAGNGSGGFVGQAGRWTQATGVVPLGWLPGGEFSASTSISADGSVIAGGSTIAGGGLLAFRWTQATGMVTLGDLAGGADYSWGQDISSDGRVIVGGCTTEEGQFAMRWTQATGMVSLGDLAGGPTESAATGVSDDGNVVVGIANSTYDVDWGGDAFIWTPARGMRYLKDAVMVQSCAAELEGWRLISAWSVSGDGRVIVGEGINPQGRFEAYMVRFGEDACRADFNRDGVVNSQDFFEFVGAFFVGC